MNSFAAAVLLGFFLAPAPYGVAINYQTRECAGYWGGDEYVDYSVPAGWTVYYPDENWLIQTELGTYKWRPPEGPEAFCNAVGYPYVSENIGKDRGVRTQLVTRGQFVVRSLEAQYGGVATLILEFIGIAAVGYGLYRVFRRNM